MYFTIGGAFIVLAIVLLLIFIQTDFYKFYRNKSAENERVYSNLNASHVANSTTEIEFPDLSQTRLKESLSITKVHNSVLLTGYGLVVIYIQTFIVFPAVMLQGGVGFISNISWQVWFIISIFNLMDTVARYVSESFMFLNEKTTVLATG
jgi:hypothetical protein